jgi:hypothetical protein
MTCAKLKLAIGTSAAIILVGGTTTVVLSSDLAGDNLPPGEIIKRAQQKYASLTSYSDEGKTVAILNGTTITTAFTIRLARPNLYRIDWEQPVHASYTNKGAVWSAGEGDFLRMGSAAEKQASQEMALGSATGISGGAAIGLAVRCRARSHNPTRKWGMLIVTFLQATRKAGRGRFGLVNRTF